MRDIIWSFVALCVAVGAGYVWGWKAKGRWFDREKIAIEAAARTRVFKENKELAAQLAEALQRAYKAEAESRVLTIEKSTRIDSIGSLAGGQPVSPAELKAINEQIREVAR